LITSNTSKDFALDLVEHGDRSFAADLDREQKVSDRDDVAQRVAGGPSRLLVVSGSTE
jgi:hypothetical protein